MDIAEYFATIPSDQRMLILVGGLVLFWMLEGVIPLAVRRKGYGKHVGVNLFFTLTTVVVNFGFAYVIVLASDFMYGRGAGLLNMVRMPLWLYIILGCMLLDLVGAYLIHVIEHRVRWMWRFHIVHHSDMHVDTTTANRHHPVESVFRAGFTLLAVVITGAPMWLVMLYQSVSVVLSQFNHANVRFPRWLDRGMSWLIVSPNMHKVHHHYVQPLTDTNYGNIFSIWDRIFGTFAEVGNTKRDIVYGIDVLMEDGESERIDRLLRFPFKKYVPMKGGKFDKGDADITRNRLQ